MNNGIKYYKVLSRNDTGETHSHQSGIAIPKKVAECGVFPDLGTDTLNPRQTVAFYDETNRLWNFEYIYYNDAFFGKPAGKAHNEHRLTCIAGYMRENGIKSGDMIWFMIDENEVRHIGFEKQMRNEQTEQNGDIIIKISLGAGWHYIKI